jgi:hypothetical protein
VLPVSAQRGATNPFRRVRPQAIGQPLADHHIARIFTFRNRRDLQPIRQLGRHVLQTVNCEIDGFIQQRFLDLFCKQPLCADLFQRPALKSVAAGRDDLDAALFTQAFSRP